jgi:hypothetical protein
MKPEIKAALDRLEALIERMACDGVPETHVSVSHAGPAHSGIGVRATLARIK